MFWPHLIIFMQVFLILKKSEIRLKSENWHPCIDIPLYQNEIIYLAFLSGFFVWIGPLSSINGNSILVGSLLEKCETNVKSYRFPRRLRRIRGNNTPAATARLGSIGSKSISLFQSLSSFHQIWCDKALALLPTELPKLCEEPCGKSYQTNRILWVVINLNPMTID